MRDTTAQGRETWRARGRGYGYPSCCIESWIARMALDLPMRRVCRADNRILCPACVADGVPSYRHGERP